jgi:hypothetical protein
MLAKNSADPVEQQQLIVVVGGLNLSNGQAHVKLPDNAQKSLLPLSPAAAAAPKSGLSFNLCGARKKGLTQEEIRCLAAIPLRPIQIKDLSKNVARRKKNKAELKTEFLVSPLY